MWNIEYRDADGKGFSDTEPWIEEGIENKEDLEEILKGMRQRGCKNIKVINTKSIGWNLLTDKKPDYYKPVLCLLEDDMQVTAALDENNTDWAMYDQALLNKKVIAWKELEKLKVTDLGLKI